MCSITGSPPDEFYSTFNKYDDLLKEAAGEIKIDEEAEKYEDEEQSHEDDP